MNVRNACQKNGRNEKIDCRNGTTKKRIMNFRFVFFIFLIAQYLLNSYIMVSLFQNISILRIGSGYLVVMVAFSSVNDFT